MTIITLINRSQNSCTVYMLIDTLEMSKHCSHPYQKRALCGLCEGVAVSVTSRGGREIL